MTAKSKVNLKLYIFFFKILSLLPAKVVDGKLVFDKVCFCLMWIFFFVKLWFVYVNTTFLTRADWIQMLLYLIPILNTVVTLHVLVTAKARLRALEFVVYTVDEIDDIFTFTWKRSNYFDGTLIFLTITVSSYIAAFVYEVCEPLLDHDSQSAYEASLGMLLYDFTKIITFGCHVSIAVQILWIQMRMKRIYTIVKYNGCTNGAVIMNALKSLRLIRKCIRTFFYECGNVILSRHCYNIMTLSARLFFFVFYLSFTDYTDLLSNIVWLLHKVASIYLFSHICNSLEQEWNDTVALLEKNLIEIKGQFHNRSLMNRHERSINLLRVKPLVMELKGFLSINNTIFVSILHSIMSFLILFIQIEYKLI